MTLQRATDGHLLRQTTGSLMRECCCNEPGGGETRYKVYDCCDQSETNYYVYPQVGSLSEQYAPSKSWYSYLHHRCFYTTDQVNSSASTEYVYSDDELDGDIFVLGCDDPMSPCPCPP